MAGHRHDHELAPAGVILEHGRQRHRLAVAIAAVLRQQGGTGQEVAAAALLVLQHGVGDLLEEAQRQGDLGAIVVGDVGHVAQRLGDRPQGTLHGGGGGGEIDHDAALAHHAPHVRLEIGLLGLLQTLAHLLGQQFGGLLVARLQRPTQAFDVAAEVDARAVAELLDLVAQIELEGAPHRIHAELAERGFGLLDRIAGQREGRGMLVPLGVLPAIA